MKVIRKLAGPPAGEFTLTVKGLPLVDWTSMVPVPVTFKGDPSPR